MNHIPDVETWKRDFSVRFLRDWHPQHWITTQEKRSLVARVGACQTWEQIRQVAPWIYLPVEVRSK